MQCPSVNEAMKQYAEVKKAGISAVEAVAQYRSLEKRVLELDKELVPLFREKFDLAVELKNIQEKLKNTQDKFENLQSYCRRLKGERAVAQDSQRSLLRRHQNYLDRTGMHTYKMRLNWFSDIEEFNKAMKERGYTYQDPLDDCNKETESYTFVSPHSLDELLDLLDTIVDGHIMKETLQYKQDYTGVRVRRSQRPKSEAL